MRKSPMSLVISHNDINTTPLHGEKLVVATERDTESGEVIGHTEMIISRPAVGEIVLTAVRREELPPPPVEQVKPKKADKKEEPAAPPTPSATESTESSSAPSTGDASDKDDAKKPEGKKNK